MNIVCALVTDPIDTGSEGPSDVEAHSEHTIENQRGTWNKDVIKFFVDGAEEDELFENRKTFLKRVFNLAFTEVDIEIPIVFLQNRTAAEEADIIIEFGPKAGDRYYADAGNVLAYAGYPDGALKGYMKIFTDWDWSVFGNLNIISVIIHELLHLLGRPHSERDWTHNDIMHPSIRASVTELSEDGDVKGLVAAYGPRVYSHDSHHDRLEKANRRSKIRLMMKEIKPVNSVK